MLRKLMLMLLLVLGVGVVSACEADDGQLGGTLVVYSPNSDGEIEGLLYYWGETRGVQIELVSAGTGEVLSRLTAEKDNPQADVQFGGMNLGVYLSNSDLYEEYVAEGDDLLPAGYQNTTGFFTNYLLSGSNLLVNTELEAELGMNITSYADLLDPRLQGRIAMGNPAASSSAFAQLTNMLLVMGNGSYEDDAAWNFIEEFMQNLAELRSPADPGSPADPEYNNGAIIDVVGNGSDFFKREVTTNGVRIMGAGAVGGQAAVPDAWLEKVARMFELFTDPTGAGINQTIQRQFIKDLSGDAGDSYHAGFPTLQRVARGGGNDYTPNFLTDEGIESWNLSPLFDTHVHNDMVWYLNSSGDGYGIGEIDAQEVIEHVFHTLHMHGLPALDLKMYPELSADWQSGDLFAAIEEAYDAGVFDPSGYVDATWKTDPELFPVIAKEYLYLLNFCMFDYSGLWDGDSLAPEWSDSMRTQSGILANNPLGYALFNTYIAPVISKPSLATINSIFGDGNTPAQDDPSQAGASGYIVDVVVVGSPKIIGSPKILGSSSAVFRNTAAGEYVVGVTYEDPSVQLLTDGATNVRVVYPSEGAVWLPAAAAIVKGAPNLENAQAFIDFLISDEGQEIVASLTNRPVNIEIPNTNPFMTPFSQINLAFENIQYTAENRSALQQRWLDIAAKYGA